MDGNADTLQGRRDENRGSGARFVSPFLRGFPPASLAFCVCLVCVVFVVFGFVLLSKPVESLLQVIPGLFFLAFAFLES